MNTVINWIEIFNEMKEHTSREALTDEMDTEYDNSLSDDKEKENTKDDSADEKEDTTNADDNNQNDDELTDDMGDDTKEENENDEQNNEGNKSDSGFDLGSASKLGPNQIKKLQGKIKLSQEIQNLISDINLMIEFLDQNPKKNLVVVKLQELKESALSLNEIVVISSLEDTMVRYELLLEQYRLLVKNLE